MKGIILAGGTGTRLLPITRVTNKLLLPVYKKPMIYYPLETLVKAGVKDILIVTGGNNPGDFLKLLGNGKEFGLREIHYAYQEGSGGIAAALSLAEDFADNGKIIVILGDNLFQDNFEEAVKKFEKQKKGAKIFLKEVKDPERFGVPVFENNSPSEITRPKGEFPRSGISRGKIITIEEKPKIPKSKYAVTGIYMYDNQVWEVVKSLKPSARGELEISDVNNFYLEQQTMSYEILRGWWVDAGTFDSMLEAANLVACHLSTL